MFRIGFGVDSHRFLSEMSDKKMILGGVEIPNHVGVESYSDGDVIYHSLFNALSSALGNKSIGEFFPDNDPVNMRKDSGEYIQFMMKLVKEKGFSISNVVFSIEGKRPKVAPHSVKIKESVAKILSISVEQVSVHATTGEGLTSFGKGEGVYCQAIVLLQKES